MSDKTDRLYVKTPTELSGCYDVREATVNDYKNIIPVDVVLKLAQEHLLESRLTSDVMHSVDKTKLYLSTKYAMEERELFVVLHLTSQHQIITEEVISYGTVNAARVYPREVVKSALRNNTSVILLAHNHPSGDSKVSMADRRITRRIQDALKLVDIKVLDHIVIGKGETSSFVEMGLI